jgi:predicted SprT family Zn-dependent metalloprotease
VRLEMRLSLAQEMIESAFEEHGLGAKGWTFSWDRARLRFGACWPKRKRISLSRVLTELNDTDHVRDTILHEIAHALVFERYGYLRGHGPEWQALALQLGATPQARTTSGKLPKGRFELVHRSTGEVYRTFQRRPKNSDLSGRYIQGRKAETLDQLIIVEL